MSPAKRRLFLSIHKWCGLGAAALILVQALTGCMLVYRWELAALLDPEGMVRHSSETGASLDRVLQSVWQLYPDYEIQRLVFPKTSEGTYLAHLVDADGRVRYASVDPGDARILRHGGVWRFPSEAAMFIHYQLMAGRAGLAFIVLMGLSLLALLVSGTVYWWLGPGYRLNNLAIRTRMPTRVVLRQIHRTTGVILAPVIVVSVATGLYLASVLLLSSGGINPTSPSGVSPVRDGDFNGAFAMARAEFPAAGIRDIRMPDPGRFRVFFWEPRINPRATHEVAVRLVNGEPIARETIPAALSLRGAIIPLHSGELLGGAGRLLILLGGTALLVLGVLGPIMWLQGRRVKPR